MTVVVTWEGIVAAIVGFSGLLAAIIAIFKYYNKGYDWVKRQNMQDEKLEELKTNYDAQMREIKEELRILTTGVLACLKGLKEKGCNGPVTEAVNSLEEYITSKAHK